MGPNVREVGSKEPPIALRGIYERRSVRSFTDEPVSRELVSSLVDAAIQAPSAMNEQPWHFTVVADKARLASISAKAKAFMLAEFSEDSHIDHLRQTLSDANFNIFYNAPALIVISAPQGSRWAIEDCAMAAQNLMLAAHSVSLGTCWIGFAQSWLNSDEGRRSIGVEPSQLVVAPIIVGHPAEKAHPVPRKKPSIAWA
jgi:nitroreductase